MSTTPVVSMEKPAVQPTWADAVEIDASCRYPVLLLFLASFGWLLTSVVLTLIASIKLHGPGFLSSIPWLTYGRLQPAQSMAFVFGFASQAGFGVMLWLLARLGRCTLKGPGLAIIGTVIWNVALKIGFFSVLAGWSTGLEHLEMPAGMHVALLLGYVFIGISAALTLHFRQSRTLYVSSWYLLGALFWFPWLYTTATYLLLLGPGVSGAVQPAITTWFGNGLFLLWLTPIGLAIVYYFLPKLTSRPLYSVELAAFAFWLLAIFGAAGGFQNRAGLPSWMTSLSSVAVVILIIPALAMALNWHKTVDGRYSLFTQNQTLAFVRLAAFSFIAWTILTGISALPVPGEWLSFSLFFSGLEALFLYGFFTMAIFGAWYYIIPKLIGAEWSGHPAGKLHYLGSVVGAFGLAASLLLGGLVHAKGLANPSVPFIGTVRSSLPFIGMSTLAILVFLAAQFFLVKMICSTCCGRCGNSVSKGTSPQKGGRK